MRYLIMALVGMFAFVCGRGPIRWTVAAYFFGWFALIPLIFLPKKLLRLEEKIDSFQNKAEEYVIAKEFNRVNTPQDLFNQLEKK
jgi:hypothetical protein